jgi:hypothetical protein
VLAQIAATLALTVATVPSLDAIGAGIAIGGGYAVFTAVLLLGRAPVEMRRTAPVVARALLVATLAAGAGRLVPAGNDLAGVVAAVAATSGVWLLLSWMLMRQELRRMAILMQTHLLRRGSERAQASRTDAV